MSKEQSKRWIHLNFIFIFIMMAPILIYGCGHFYEKLSAGPEFKKASDFSNQGDYQASLRKYEEIIAQYPEEGDRALFEMGIIYAFPRNQQKDYQKSLEYFRKLIKSYPGSGYRHDSEVMISLIDDITRKDKRIRTQQRQLELFEHEVKNRDKKIILQKKQIEALDQSVKEIEKKMEQMKKVDRHFKDKKKLSPM